MKRDRNSIAKRRQSFLLYIQEHQNADVTALAEKFQVSPITVRRDIKYFEEKGLMKHYFGGVQILPQAPSEEPYFETAEQDTCLLYTSPWGKS